MRKFTSLWRKLYVLLSVIVLTLLVMYFQAKHVSAVNLLALISGFALFNWLACKTGKDTFVLASGGIYALYLLAEILVYGLLCADVLRPDWPAITGKNLSAASRPYVLFDSISGYKYVPGQTRLTNIKDRLLVYDHPLHINKQGYCSVNDFSFRKTKQGEKRLVVFGDSFSAGEIADTSWVDIANQLLAADSETAGYKLYNFSLEGAGVCNWNSIFFKEVIRQYDFDGVLFAVYGSDKNYYSSDLARDFIIKHSDAKETGLGFFEKLPTDGKEFHDNFLSELIYSCSTYSDEEISHYKLLALEDDAQGRTFRLVSPFPYFLQYMDGLCSSLWKLHRFKKKYSSQKLVESGLTRNFDNLEQLRQYYGNRKYHLFTDMLDYCRKNNKEIWLASITSFEMAGALPDHFHTGIYNNQLRLFAKEYGANFIDGFTSLDTLPVRDNKALARYTLPGDSHWNQQGERLYARLIYGEIKKGIR